MVTNKVVPAVLEVVGEEAIWEDDNAVIHRTAAAMEACGVFERIEPRMIAAKMADIWPIEQVIYNSYNLYHYFKVFLLDLGHIEAQSEEAWTKDQRGAQTGNH